MLSEPGFGHILCLARMSRSLLEGAYRKGQRFRSDEVGSSQAFPEHPQIPR